MGLKISTFKKGGQTFTDAYAKIGNVKYDNDTKVASFGIKIFVGKNDRNLITEIHNQCVRLIVGEDMLKQCYLRINTLISQMKSQIERIESENSLIVDDDNLKLRNEGTIAQIKNAELLQLENSIDW
jgi:hypothetical protein